MYRVLGTSRTGVKAIERKIDSLADDLANVNTYGYKRREIGFQELLTNEIHENDVLRSDNLGHSRINVGAKSQLATINFQQGGLISSDSPFDLAIEGAGFFGLYDRDGNLILTRNGGFQLNADKSISDDQARRLSMELYSPVEGWETENISISSQGEIIDGNQNILARVILYQPEVLDSLIPLGEGGYLPNPGLGLDNSLDNPDGFGSINQGYLEASNVHMAKTMTDLIIAQRSYSTNLRALQSTDDMMDTINGIKR